MPRRKFPKKVEGVPLDLSELCAHDDLCTDILIDQTRYHTTIPKCQTRYVPARGVTEGDVVTVLHDMVVLRANIQGAVKEMMQWKPVKKYWHGLDTETEKRRFEAHARLYVHMYSTDCPWEVSSTNRYTLATYEATVVARTTIVPGVIPYLKGVTVDITAEEAAAAELGGWGTSVMISTKTKSACVMLGPARFVNHDCSANAALRPVEGGVEVVALRQIVVDEEITVRYGGDYFGPDNDDCLCASCEQLERGGWQPSVNGAAARVTPDYHDQTRVPSQYAVVRQMLATGLHRRAHGRVPADYVLTQRLLVNQHDRWTRCSMAACRRVFVQPDGYQTRRECPRCERHRIIHGALWPEVVAPEGSVVGGRCGKGRWVVDGGNWAPPVKASTVFLGTSRLITRQGLRMEGELAKIRGDVVDDKFQRVRVGKRTSRRRRL